VRTLVELVGEDAVLVTLAFAFARCGDVVVTEEAGETPNHIDPTTTAPTQTMDERVRPRFPSFERCGPTGT
jgi:hypothetical protein